MTWEGGGRRQRRGCFATAAPSLAAFAAERGPYVQRRSCGRRACPERAQRAQGRRAAPAPYLWKARAILSPSASASRTASASCRSQAPSVTPSLRGGMVAAAAAAAGALSGAALGGPPCRAAAPPACAAAAHHRLLWCERVKEHPRGSLPSPSEQSLVPNSMARMLGVASGSAPRFSSPSRHHAHRPHMENGCWR